MNVSSNLPNVLSGKGKTQVRKSEIGGGILEETEKIVKLKSCLFPSVLCHYLELL